MDVDTILDREYNIVGGVRPSRKTEGWVSRVYPDLFQKYCSPIRLQHSSGSSGCYVTLNRALATSAQSAAKSFWIVVLNNLIATMSWFEPSAVREAATVAIRAMGYKGMKPEQLKVVEKFVRQWCVCLCYACLPLLFDNLP